MSMHPESRVHRQVRRFGFGRTPLRRTVDRVETAILLVAGLIAVLVVPAAMAVGTAASDASKDAAAQRRAVLTETPAQTLSDAGSWAGAMPGQTMAPVLVAWTDTAGKSLEGWTYAMLGTKSGSEVTIWLDRSGAIVTPPRQPADSEAIGTLAGSAAAMAAWLTLIGLTRLAVVRLDRRRARDLDREWERIAPRWRHHES
ncbi:hypothetical protein [Kribbella sp. VKM Ac-2568]|uniref:Rv1733c family protein n=1 Tax=Kribbella sp. VKM Ac-2568 TaxID=2512219 RepID=UPI0010490FB7|nr:hypothetical protein [Kribbella sp. VKM Ac-2568]TCM37263.1 hypothetical protein EV648_120100 [Kribbella sp. VKM Ac-2568]